MGEDLAEAPLPPPPPPNAEPLQTFSNESEKSRFIPLPRIKFDGDWRKYAAVKVSSEFDSEESVFNNKISARVFDGIAKIKASFQRSNSGVVRYPELGLVTKYLSVLYDHEARNALVKASADLSQRFQLKLLTDVKPSFLWHPQLRLVTKYFSLLYHLDGSNVLVTTSFDHNRHIQLKALFDIKAKQGEVKLLTSLADSRYKAEVSCDVPFTGLPRAVVTFPNGEIKLEDEIQDKRQSLVYKWICCRNLMNGLCVAEYNENNLNLKYKYKDEEMTITPSISLPSNLLSLGLKRQFNPLNKLSYFYNFNSTEWNAVYKHQPIDDFKVKVGYDSRARLGWAAAWVGKENVGAKKAPRKLKFQVMLQVPQDDVKSYAVLFKVKKTNGFIIVLSHSSGLFYQ